MLVMETGILRPDIQIDGSSPIDLILETKQ